MDRWTLIYFNGESTSFFILFLHGIRLAVPFARQRAGRSMPARMAMIAITTNSSISVNARARAREFFLKSYSQSCITCLTVRGWRSPQLWFLTARANGKFRKLSDRARPREVSREHH